MPHSPVTIAVGGARPYDISVGPGLLADAALLAAAWRGRHALVVSDEHVAPLYADALHDRLAGAKPQARIARFVLPPGEAATRRSTRACP